MGVTLFFSVGNCWYRKLRDGLCKLFFRTMAMAFRTCTESDEIRVRDI